MRKMTQSTVSQHWKTMVCQGRIPSDSAH